MFSQNFCFAKSFKITYNMELLAPSDKNTFFEAVNNGADAVYIGLKEFSARQSADNITLEELDYYLSYAHLFGVKVYCAVNTLVKDEELSDYFNLILSAYAKGVDAFILQDIFLGKYLKENYPDIVLHLSTQAGVNNLISAKLAKKYGFTRVILSRETQKEEIKEIASEIETEIFVHGALCSSFSGHCYYSSYIGGNSGNRGRCKQPCRQPFFYNDKQLGKYNLSLSDLMLCDYIEEIKNLGVKSIKIEGRMRSREYCAKAVSLYRKAIDGQNYLKEKQDLAKIYNRGDYTTGYYNKDKNLISDKIQSHKGSFFAKIEKIKQNKLFCNKTATEGDCFKILRDGYEIGNATYLNGNFVYKGNVLVGDLLYITKDNLLINNTINKKRIKQLDFNIEIINDKIKVIYLENNKEYLSESIVQSSINKPTTKQEIIDNFDKTDIYPFKISLNFIGDFSNIFIPKSKLNEFRRKVFEQIFSNCQNKKIFKIKDFIWKNDDNSVSNQTAIIISNLKHLTINADKYIFLPNDYNLLNDITSDINFVSCDKEKYLFIPAYLNNKDLEIISKYISFFDGVYADGLSGIALADKFNKKLFIGMGLNVFNSLTYSVIKSNYPKADICLSKEIDKSFEIKQAFKQNKGSFYLMDLIYCPFRNNCNNCSKENIFECSDNYEQFRLFRYKLSSCRFLLYSKKTINNYTNTNKLINLISLDDNEIIDLLNNKIKTFTFNKGVL